MGVRSFFRGLLYFTEARSTASPNATIPAHSFTPRGSETSIDTVIATKYQGSLMTAVPDGTATGGNKRGIASVDLQLSRTLASQVASGQSATISGGIINTASGQNSVVGGGSDNAASGASATVSGGEHNAASGEHSSVVGGGANTASGGYSAVLGGDSNAATGLNSAVLAGAENLAAGRYSVAMGVEGHARHPGEFAQGNVLAQHGSMVMYAQTTNAAPTQMTFDGTNMIVPLDDEVWGIRARVSARCKSLSKAWVTDLEFAVANFGGTLVQMQTTDIGLDKKIGSPTWTAVVYVSGDNVSVTVTGANSETVDWAVDFWYGRIGNFGN